MERVSPADREPLFEDQTLLDPPTETKPGLEPAAADAFTPTFEWSPGLPSRAARATPWPGR